MRTPKMSQPELVGKLSQVFSTHGYNGVTLADLAKAAELNKASLYHFFPEGKEAMAVATLEMVKSNVQEHIVDILNTGDSLNSRLKATLKNIDSFYDGGQKACLLELMNSSTTGTAVKVLIAEVFDMLIKAFSSFYLEAGYSKAESKTQAENTVIGIQGSLVLSRALGSKEPFKKQLKQIEKLALEKINSN
jgi:AcrR family transcriptional regulator